MRRRLTLAILGTTAAALLLTGLGTLLLTRLQIRHTTRTELRSEAEAFVPFVTQEVRAGQGVSAQEALKQQRRRLTVARRSLNLADASIVVFDGSGTLVAGTLPDGLDAGMLDVAALRAGTAQSGDRGRQVWAAAPSQQDPTGRFFVVALTRQIPFGLGSAQWLFLAGAVVLLLAVLVSVRLSRALTAPLLAADVATRRIADGDLTARVPDPPLTADDELADLSRAINTMAERLERSRGVEQQFLMSVSHDLRTPLTSIRGYAEAITDGAATDPEAAAAVILLEARRLERLVRDLLDLARLDARQFSLDLEPVDLVDVAATAVAGFSPAAADAGVQLTSTTAPGTVAWVSADRDRLAQVTANLVENALKFARSRIDVAVAVAGDRATLTVTDDGPGIADDDLPHVFERLYVSKAQPVRKESGSGLGLAITQQLLAAMGGTVDVESRVGTGTRFVVALRALPVNAAP